MKSNSYLLSLLLLACCSTLTQASASPPSSWRRRSKSSPVTTPTTIVVTTPANNQTRSTSRWPFLTKKRNNAKTAQNSTAVSSPSSSSTSDPDEPAKKSPKSPRGFHGFFPKKESHKNATSSTVDQEEEKVEEEEKEMKPEEKAEAEKEEVEQEEDDDEDEMDFGKDDNDASSSTGILILRPQQLQSSSRRSHRYNHNGRQGAHPLSRNGKSNKKNQGIPPRSAVVLESLVLTIFTQVTKVWLLTKIRSWLTLQEDSIKPVQHFAFERLNDRYLRDATALRNALSAPPLGVGKFRWKLQHVKKALGKAPKDETKLSDMYKRTVVVVEIDTTRTHDTFKLHDVADIVSFLLQQYRSHVFGTQQDNVTPNELEIVLAITSPGGSAITFGLAAAQIQRLAREPGVHVTVCVDHIAASGGYMMASQSHKLVAAPFAVVGSIGVIAESLNYNELATRYGIKPIVMKSGDSKNPITSFGEVTKREIRQRQADMDKLHSAFKSFVVQGRPVLQDSLLEVADGSSWIGQDALDMNMIDEIMTSDDYIQQRVESFDRVLKLHRFNPNRLSHFLHLYNPLDTYPETKAWLVDKLWGRDNGATVSFLVQTASIIGMMYHSFTKGALKDVWPK
jgi:serine protease SohB